MKKELKDLRAKFIDIRTSIAMSRYISDERLESFYEPYCSGLTYELNIAIELATSMKYSEESNRKELRLMIESLDKKINELMSIYESEGVVSHNLSLSDIYSMRYKFGDVVYGNTIDSYI